MSDDFTADDEFAETHGVWWAGIVFASVVTFVIIGGLLISGTYVLSDLGLLDIPYWLPIATAAVLTGVLVTIAVMRGEIRYEPR